VIRLGEGIGLTLLAYVQELSTHALNLQQTLALQRATQIHRGAVHPSAPHLAASAPSPLC
jgi:hypothetical protein